MSKQGYTKHLFARSFFMIAVLLFVPTRSSAISFTGVGDLHPAAPGETSYFTSRAYGVSADGTKVVGSAGVEGISRATAFVWDSSTGMQTLGELPGGSTSSIATAASGDGSVIVGQSRTSAGEEAFIWDATNGMRRLVEGDGSGALIRQSATGVSADGITVVGNDVRGAVGAGYVWTAATGIEFVNDLPGGQNFANVSSISANGSSVVGISGTATNGGAALWDPPLGPGQDLGGLPGPYTLYSAASDVSADGSTVVGVSGPAGPAASGEEAFLWTAEEGIQGLGFLPGSGTVSQARAVSGDGSTVVGRGTTSAGFEAFVWTESGGMQALEVLLTSLGLDVSGWQLAEATDVSADGRTIVGVGINPSGFEEGFVAVIPEPGTGLLFGIGLVGLASWRHFEAC